MSVRFQSLSTSATGTWSAMLKVRSKSEKRSPPSTASEPTAAPATTRSSSSASRSRRSRRASRCSTVNTMRDPTSAVSRTAPADLGRGHRDTPSEDSTSRGIRQTVPSRQSHSNMSISCSDCEGRARQLVLEAVIEADALLPGKRMGMMGVVGRDEVQDGVARCGGIGQLAAGQALLAQDGEPRFNKGEPGGMQWQPVEAEAPGTQGNVGGHLGRAVQAHRIEDEMNDLRAGHLGVQEAQEFDELGGAMLAADDAAHGAGLPLDGGQQVRCAVAHVLELAPGGLAGGRRLARRAGGAHADARLLIDAKGRTVGRWLQLHLDHLHGFGHEVRVALLRPGVKGGPGADPLPGGYARRCSCWGRPAPTPGGPGGTAPGRPLTSASGPPSPARQAPGTPGPRWPLAARRDSGGAAGRRGGPPTPPAPPCPTTPPPASPTAGPPPPRTRSRSAPRPL